MERLHVDVFNELISRYCSRWMHCI